MNCEVCHWQIDKAQFLRQRVKPRQVIMTILSYSEVLLPIINDINSSHHYHPFHPGQFLLCMAGHHYIIHCLVFVIDFRIFSANNDYECLPSFISGSCATGQHVGGLAHEDKPTEYSSSQSCTVNENTLELVWNNSNRTVPNTVGASQAPTEIPTAKTDAMHPPTTEIVTQTQRHTQKRTTVNLHSQFASSTFLSKSNIALNSSEQNSGDAHSASNKTFQGREQQRSTESTDQPKISKNLPIYIAVPVAVMLILVVAVVLIIKKRWPTKTIYIRRELPALPEAQNTSREATQTHIYEGVRDETSRSGHEYSTVDDETYETVPPSSGHIVTDEVELSNRNHQRSQNLTNREDKIVYVYNATSDP